MRVVIEVTLGLIIGILWEFFIILFVLIIILIIVVARKNFGPKKPEPAQESEEQDERGFDWMSDDTHGSLKEYEDEYLARQGIKSTSRKPTARRKPAETRESESNFCDNCGKSLRPTAKFCSGCGSPRS